MKIIISEPDYTVVYESTEFDPKDVEEQKELAFASLDTKYNDYNPDEKRPPLIMEIKENNRTFVTKI